MMAKSLTAKLGTAALLLSYATVTRAADARAAPNVEQKKALYAVCLDSEFSNLLRPNLDDANVYPLVGLKDEEIGQTLKAKCRVRIQAMTPMSESEMVEAFDTVDEAMQFPFVRAAQQRRPALVEKMQAIRAKGPRSAIALAEVVNADDYPPAAVRANDQGTSMATYTVGINGRVSDCTATGASDLLNNTFCGIIMRRWRYAPAVNADDQPVTEVRTRSVTFGTKTIGGLQ